MCTQSRLISLAFYIVLHPQGIRKQMKTLRKRHRVHIALDYVHTVSFSLAFYIVLRPQGIRKQMKTLRKRHCVHIVLLHIHVP